MGLIHVEGIGLVHTSMIGPARPRRAIATGDWADVWEGSKVAKYQRKSEVVDAFRWTGGPEQIEDPEWAVKAMKADVIRLYAAGTPAVSMEIVTREVLKSAQPGWYILQYANGDLDALPPTTFHNTFEKVNG